MKQLPVSDDTLHLRVYEVVNITAMVIRLYINPRKCAELIQNIGVIPSCSKDFDQISRFFNYRLQRLQKVYPDISVHFVQCINANRYPGVDVRNFNEQLLAFFQCEPWWFLNHFFAVFVDVYHRFQNSVTNLRELLDKCIQYAYRFTAILLCSTAIEICHLLRVALFRNQSVNDLRSMPY